MSAGAGDTEGSHPLNSRFTLYEWSERDRSVDDGWKGQLRALVGFSTVEEFWHAWHFVPKLSEVFKVTREMDPPKVTREVEKGGSTKTRSSCVKGYALFRDGFQPLSEQVGPDGEKVHKARRLTEVKPGGKSDVARFEKAWEVTVLATIGELVDADGVLNGVYVFDKTEGKPRSTPPKLRIELWMATDDDVACAHVTKRMAKLLADEIPGPAFEFRKSGGKYF